jgi:hypothetical protein
MSELASEASLPFIMHGIILESIHNKNVSDEKISRNSQFSARDRSLFY